AAPRPRRVPHRAQQAEPPRRGDGRRAGEARQEGGARQEGRAGEEGRARQGQGQGHAEGGGRSRGGGGLMAASSSGGDDDGMVSGINVTPLVDITLVLLIIFMVTAKLIVSQSLPLDLPKAANGQEVQMVFGVELHANGDTVVNGKKIANDAAVLPLAKEEL